MTRYVYKKVPLDPWEALLNRRDEIDRTVASIRELSRTLDELTRAPLPKTRLVQIALNPGDEGYDEAPVVFNPRITKVMPDG